MGNLNKVMVIGRIGQDLELKTSQKGTSILNFSLATSEYWKDQLGNKQERTEWHRIVAFQRNAEVIAQYCRKGSQIYVEGSLQTREWQDKEGNKRYTTEVICRNLQLLDSKQDNNSGGYSQPQHQAQPNQSANNGGFGGNDNFDESEIPF